MRLKRKDTERFWKRFKIDQATGCWLWTNHLNHDGYGQLKLANTDRNVGAHRISYVIHNGKVPRGFVVCHKCDVRNCVNPHHLFSATQSDNVYDSIAKGRHYSCRPPIGSKTSSAKLTEEKVLDLIHRYLNQIDLTQCALAKEHGVDINTINGIFKGRTWQHVAAPYLERLATATKEKNRHRAAENNRKKGHW